jgi:hypothetical protein
MDLGDGRKGMKELIVIPTYKRPEMLFYCLSLLRNFAPEIPVAVFPDRGTLNDKETLEVLDAFDPDLVQGMLVPEHDYYGNTYNVMEALRWAYCTRAELIYYIEDDVMIHEDFFAWHREMHEEFGDDIFAAMGWVFNHYAPITVDPMFQPWYYAIGTSFKREKLAHIVEHATPRYYEAMPEYVQKTFKNSILNSPINITHYEQDGLIQRVIDVDKSQTVCSGIARCSHLGVFGYNRGWEKRDDFFGDAKTFEARLAKISQLIGDPYWRASLFGRAIVEREIGKILPPRLHKYLLKLGAFECDYESELAVDQLPKRLRSVPRSPEMEIVVK